MRDPLAAIVQAASGGAVVAVHVQPRSGTTQLVGRHGDAVRIRVTAPPVDGRATEAARSVLADALGVPASSVTLVSGERSRLKRFQVAGVPAEVVVAQLAARLAPPQG
jgi:uncharacterized protein (TIGR00251 family)